MRQTTTIKSYTTDPEYDLKVTLGWELNLWGAMTWAKRQGAASYKASVEDWRAMRMTLVAEVASAYFRLIALDNELAIVRRTLITRQEGVEQARIRFEGRPYIRDRIPAGKSGIRLNRIARPQPGTPDSGGAKRHHPAHGRIPHRQAQPRIPPPRCRNAAAPPGRTLIHPTATPARPPCRRAAPGSRHGQMSG